MAWADEHVAAKAVAARVTEQGAETLLTLAEVVALVASRTMEPYDDERTARNRVRNQVGRAGEKAKQGVGVYDGGLQPRGEKYVAGEVVSWAKQLYGSTRHVESFKDLPSTPMVIDCSVGEKLGTSAGADVDLYPGTNEASHLLIKTLTDTIRKIEADAAQKEVARRQKLLDNLKGKK